jgi:hypothetical protein
MLVDVNRCSSIIVQRVRKVVTYYFQKATVRIIKVFGLTLMRVAYRM